MMVIGGIPLLRDTGYDLRPAISELRAAGLAFEEQLQRSLLEPADPDEVSSFLEPSARRE